MRRLLTIVLLGLAACAPHRPPATSGAPTTAAPAPAPAAYAFDAQVTGAGPPMILIPGLACDGSVWDGTVAHYRERYQVHVLTLAGFAGRTPVAAPFLSTVRDDLARYIREHHLVRPVIVGHSLGGFVAFWLAVHDPELPGAIVAVDGVPYLAALGDAAATPAAMQAPAARMRERLAGASADDWARQNRAALAAMITDPAEVARIAGPSARSSPAAVADAVFEMLTTDLRPEVARIRVPTLLLAAGTGAPTAYEAQVAGIVDHRVLGFPDAKHFIMLDAPAAFFAAVDGFLAHAGATPR